MRHRYSTTRGLRPLSLVDIGRCYRSLLPFSERAQYDAYLSHVGRGDFVSATQLADDRADPKWWVDSEASVFKNVRQAYSLVEKVSCKGDQSAEDAAWLKFLKMEAKCKRTNRKIRYARSHLYRIGRLSGGVVTLSTVTKIQEIISRILGDIDVQYPKILESLSYGPGMSLSSRSPEKTSLPFKLTDSGTATIGCIPVISDYLKMHPEEVLVHCDLIRENVGPFRGKIRVNEVPGCRITFVDKTSVIKRTIAIEPSWNGSLQLAVHRELAKRLKRVGIDLSDQTRNRSLAFRSSLTGESGTIDLSSASDTVSIELVRWLLPPDWFSLLDSLRSPVGVYRSNTVVFEKFSSMGNGFTFALETMIFYAICAAICDTEDKTLLSVYGDDIIVPSPSFNSVVKGLQFFGFLPNRKKSFGSGPFRESCGLDAFKGVDVRPVFVRGVTPSLLERFSLHNQFYKKGLYDVCKIIIESIPTTSRLFGPPGPTDGYLFSEEAEVLRRFRRWDKRVQAFGYKSFLAKGLTFPMPALTLLEASLFSNGVYSSGAPLRFRTKLVRSTVHRDY